MRSGCGGCEEESGDYKDGTTIGCSRVRQNAGRGVDRPHSGECGYRRAGVPSYGQGLTDFTKTGLPFRFFKKALAPSAGGRKNVSRDSKMTQECRRQTPASPARLHHSVQLEAKSPQNVVFWRKRRARSLFMTHTSVEEIIFSSEGG